MKKPTRFFFKSRCICTTGLIALISNLTMGVVQATDFSWITTGGGTWTANQSSTRMTYYGTPTPGVIGPVGTDNLAMTANGPLSLQNSGATLPSGTMDRAINNLSSTVAGANIASGATTSGVGFTSLTVNGDLTISTSGNSLTFYNSSGLPTTAGAMTTNVLGNVSIDAGASLYLGLIQDTGTPTGGNNYGSYLNGFTANSEEVGKGQINVNGRLMLNRNTTSVVLGDVSVGAAGGVTLTGAGAADLEHDGTFNKTISSRSLSGTGFVENSIVTGDTTSTATLALNTLASTNANFGGVLRNGNGTAAVLNLTVSGSGRQVLTGDNTYTGTTTINGGTLIVGLGGAGSLAQTDVSVNNTGALSGSGAIAGSVTVNSGGTLSPGNSPGTQGFGDLALNAGGNYNWQIHNAEGTSGSADGWDLIQVTDTLDLTTLTDANQFNINLWSLSGIGPDANGNALNFDNTLSYQWTLITADTINYNGTYAVEDLFAVNVGSFNGTGGFTNATLGTWSVSLSGDESSLFLNYSAIPEPSTTAFAIFAILFAAGLWMKRRQRVG